MSNKKELASLEQMMDVFDKGMRVEAVDVVGVDPGMRGMVRYVLDNGDIVVCWQNGDETQVKFGRGDIVKITKEVVHCSLGLNRGKNKDECLEDCSRCGWNPKIEKARRLAIQSGQMREDRNGIRRLVLNREGVVD